MFKKHFKIDRSRREIRSKINEPDLEPVKTLLAVSREKVQGVHTTIYPFPISRGERRVPCLGALELEIIQLYLLAILVFLVDLSFSNFPSAALEMGSVAEENEATYWYCSNGLITVEAILAKANIGLRYFPNAEGVLRKVSGTEEIPRRNGTVMPAT